MNATTLFLLSVLMFHPDGSTTIKNEQVAVPTCTVKNGLRTEDVSCGVRACMKLGKEKAAQLWGQNPGSTSAIMCNKDGMLAGEEGAKAGGGHPALSFEKKD
jgi:hypothetical protein